MKNNKNQNDDWDPEDEFTSSFDCDECVGDDHEFIYNTIQEIRYLETEGFLKVHFHPDFPKDYLRAKLFWKSPEENMKEIEHLLK
jgi:hypothetical protein